MGMYFVNKICINRAAFYKHKSLNDLLLSFDDKIVVGNLIDFAKYLQRKITDIEKTENILPENSFFVNEAATEMYRIEIRRCKDDIVVAYMECRQVKDIFYTEIEQGYEDYLKSRNKQNKK